MPRVRETPIWIDLDNSPHVPLFMPIIHELHERGYSTVLTARDCFQVHQLADLLKVDCRLIGRHYGKNKLLKILGTLYRSLQLAGTVRRQRPVLSLSHGSRSQLLTSALLGIPSVMMADYEHIRGFVRPTWVMVPDVVPDSAVRFGRRSVIKYPGIKEDVYVPSFRPDVDIRTTLGLRQDDLVVTLRPPADEAHYHNAESEMLFRAVVEFLLEADATRAVVLPRTDRQAATIRQRWPAAVASRKIVIPTDVVNGLNLIWFSDLVVSGGGTMNREAAALGVPVYSVFRGKIGAVDQYLARQGRLTLLVSSDDVRRKIVLQRRLRPDSPVTENGRTLGSVVDHLVRILEGG